MPGFTARTGMYLPGGGSLGIGGDDEIADIDRINQNLMKIDEAIGMPTSSTMPADPFPGQVVSVDGGAYFWDGTGGVWRQIAPHVGTTPPQNPQEGYLWVDTN